MRITTCNGVGRNLRVQKRSRRYFVQAHGFELICCALIFHNKISPWWCLFGVYLPTYLITYPSNYLPTYLKKHLLYWLSSLFAFAYNAVLWSLDVIVAVRHNEKKTSFKSQQTNTLIAFCFAFCFVFCFVLCFARAKKFYAAPSKKM